MLLGCYRGRIGLCSRWGRAYCHAMSVLEQKQDVPLSISQDGTIRIAGSRVSLESVLHHYLQGATAEEIGLRFPVLRLADIHSSLAYYLNHQESVQEYLTAQQQRAQKLEERIKSDTVQQQGIAQMRERLRNRVAARQRKVS